MIRHTINLIADWAQMLWRVAKVVGGKKCPPSHSSIFDIFAIFKKCFYLVIEVSSNGRFGPPKELKMKEFLHRFLWK
jgi:hypothetical protein